jgi:hypothetical protein
MQNQKENQNEWVSDRNIHEKPAHIYCVELEQLVGLKLSSKGLALFFSKLF